MKTVSLYSGIGGLDYAFRLAGFDILAAQEPNKLFRDVYKVNFPDCFMFDSELDDLCPCVFQHRKPEVILADLTRFNASEFTLRIDRVIHVIDECKVKIFVIGSSILDESLDKLMEEKFKDLNYDIYSVVMNGKDFGDIEDKERTFFVGYSKDMETYELEVEAKVTKPRTLGNRVFENKVLEFAEKKSYPKRYILKFDNEEIGYDMIDKAMPINTAFCLAKEILNTIKTENIIEDESH